MMEEKAEVVDAEVVTDEEQKPKVDPLEGLERDLQAYQEKKRAAWINDCKNRAAHMAKVVAKRKAAARAAKKARKINRKRK